MTFDSPAVSGAPLEVQYEEDCPSCGRCPHCGRKDEAPVVIPMPYPVYPQPTPYAPPPIYPGPIWTQPHTITCDSGASSIVKGTS